MSEFFKVGDVVRLKSGGPNMVVTDPNSADDDEVAVAWISDDGRSQNWSFPAACLQRV